MRLGWRWKAGALALALTSFGCSKSAVESGPDSGIECIPLPVTTCPDGGGPSFEGAVFPKVFGPVCDNCHAPGQQEANMPLISYQQIYSYGYEILSQVDSCMMPPNNAPVQLSDDQRQMLSTWYACGAPDSPARDAGTSD
ncbi:MAG TPA: hypothetical protein VGL72_00995 [Bryobacteraceae bacterium]